MNDDLMSQFLSEGRDLVASAGQELAALTVRPDDAKALEACFRAIHTLKGSSGLFDLTPMGAMLHAAEDLLSHLRAERTGIDADFDALLSVVDHVDRWLEVLERTGKLPADAPQVSQTERRRLGELVATVSVAASAATRDPVTTWRPSTALASKGSLAIRYTPRDDCFFSGDDPVAIIASVPGLSALKLSPRAPWGPLADYDPYACNLVLEATSTASRAEVETALRLVSDQVELIELIGDGAAPSPDGEGPRKTLRVDAERIDRLAGLADDLVIAKNGLVDLAAQAEALAGGQALGQALRSRQAQLDRLVADLHATVGKVRLVALGPLFGRFHRLTREIAQTLGKAVRLEESGGEVEVDKAIVDGLFDPLLHVLRNAIDHGVETAKARADAAKPLTAVIRLAARAASDQVVIEVADDGAGVDPARIRVLAVERGILDQQAADALDDAAAVDLIFTPGFSTAAQVSTLSGRGVGMDVVRAAATRLGGRVFVESQVGKGTCVRFVLPVTMVLTKVLVVTCGAERYGLDLGAVVETVRLTADRITPVRAGRAFQLRQDVIPLLALGSLIGAEAPQAQGAQRVVVARVDGELIGFAVDAIADRMEAAVRPMTGLLVGAPGVMGTTLLADGSVLMILDLVELVR